MEAALQAVTLKPASTKVSDPLKSASPTIDAALWNSANIEHWYAPIKDHTFATHFLGLSIPTARAIVQACTHHLLAIDDPPQQDYIVDNDLLAQLAHNIDAVVQQFPSKAAFVKLSCRSPKDATVASGKTHRLYEEVLARLEDENHLKDDDNNKVRALYEAHLTALKVNSGREAVELFCQSSRIQQDLEMSLEHEDRFDIQVIVREWVDIPISCEFRGFVYDGTLTGLSQYFDMCYFPDLHARKDELVQRLRAKFDEIKEAIPMSSYILDLCISKEGRAYVIELNPFSRTTDSALFSWDFDEDVLRRGPFEFRLRESPIRQAKYEVLRPWQQYFS